MGDVLTAPILTAASDREAWLDARRRCLTATDVAAVIGEHPYRTAREVYLEKTGQLPEKPENDAMRWGNLLEAVVAEEWSRRNGLAIAETGFTLHPDEPIFGATPDRLVGDDAVLEVKTAGFHAGQNFGPSESDEVPMHYLCQTLWQCFVTGRKRWYLAVLIGGNDYRQYSGKFDERIVRSMAHRARKFWHEYVLNDCPPPLSGHEPDTALVNARLPREGGEVRATDEVEADVAALGHLKVQKGALELEEARLVNRLKEFMSVNEALTLLTDEGPFRVSYQTRKATDWKAIAKAAAIAPELIAAHTTEKETPVFRTPFKTDRA